MTGDGQGLGEEVGVIAPSRDEHGAEVSLSDSIPDPMPAHVDRLRHLEVDAVGRETDSNLIVAEDRGRGLRVAHVGQYLPLVGCDAGGGEGAGILCLRHEGADDRNAGAVGGDGVVGWGVIAEVPEEVMATGDTAGAGSGKVRGVGVAAEYHCGGAVDFSAVGVGGDVAEEAVESDDGGGGGGGLLRSKGTGSGKDAGIQCPTIVKQIANGYLQFFGLSGSGGGRVVQGGGALRGSGTISRRGVDGRG